MPLYEYTCESCGKTFELLVMGRDLPTCPYCRSDTLAKQMSRFAFRSGSATGDSDDHDNTASAKCAGCAGRSCSTCH